MNFISLFTHKTWLSLPCTRICFIWVVWPAFKAVCSSVLLYLSAKNLLHYLCEAVIITFWKHWIVLFFQYSLILLDVVIQVALIPVCCAREVCHMEDVVLHVGSVEVNIELGICLRNVTEQKRMIIVHRMCGKFIFLISLLAFQIIYYIFIKRSDVGRNTGGIFFSW